jgi:two-component system phosphate regulon response regulator PhoB
MQRVLVVEDEKDIADLIGYNLEQAGYAVSFAYDGLKGSEMALRERPDLIVLDLMLPGKSGGDLIRGIRQDEQAKDIPVIMLTALEEMSDRIRGFEAGADDYMTKPFSPRELILRVGAVLKRRRGILDQYITRGPFSFDKTTRQFYLEQQPVDLTTTEFKLLLYLSERWGRTQERAELLESVWGYRGEVVSRTLDTHVRRLRKKLGPHAGMVETVSGVGYRAGPVRL